MRLAGAWMTEKVFYSNTFTMPESMLEKHKIILRTIMNCITAYGWIILKLKDFEGIYATAFQEQSHFCNGPRSRNIT
jgi:hypothetical protein